jgi:hypothetical protein
MKRNWFTSKLATSAAVLALTGVCANSAAAKDHHDNQGFEVITVKALDTAKTTDLFLLKGQGRKQFLYLESADGKLTIFDATHPSQLRKLSSWTLSGEGDTQNFRIQPLNHRFAVASDSKTGDNLTVLDLSNTPSEAIAKHLKNVDAYAIDGANQVLYVARAGELTVMRFDHPITRDAEIWEQSFEAR